MAEPPREPADAAVGPPPLLPGARWSWWLATPAVVVACWAYRTTLGFGLLADARFLIVDNNRLRRWADLWPNLTNDYFWSASGNTIPYWRPLTKASWLAETIVGNGATWPFHAVQVAWWAAACAGVTVLALELEAWPIWACAAGIAVALHPAAAEPVGLVMARSDIVAVAGSVWALVGYARAQRDGRIRWQIVQLLALGVALGSKEAAVAVPATLGVWALLRRAPGQSYFVAIRPVLPALGLTIVYFLLRRAALGSRQGAELALDPLRWVAGAGQYAVALLPGRLATGVANLPRNWAAEPEKWVPGAVALLVVAAWAAWAWRRRALDVVLLAWIALALAPVLLVDQLNVPGVDGKIALADRWLLPAAVAAQVLFAVALSRLRQVWPARIVLVAIGLWAACRLLTMDEQVAAYADESALVTMEDRAYAALPAAYRTQQDRCRHATRELVRLGQGADFAGVIAAADRAEPACQADAEFRFNRFAALVQAGRYATAVAAGQALLQQPTKDQRFAAPTRFLLAKSMLLTGDAAHAEPLLQQALRLGMQSCALAELLGRAREAQLDWPAAAQWYGRAAKCVQNGGAGPDLTQAGRYWLAAAKAWHQVGQRDKVLRDLERARRTLGATATDPAADGTPTLQ